MDAICDRSEATHLKRIENVMRGVREFVMKEAPWHDSECEGMFDMLYYIFENIRGIEALRLSFPTTGSLFFLHDDESKYLRGIRELSLTGCTLDMDYSPEEVFQDIRGVQTLELVECHISIPMVLQNLRGIKNLYIRQCDCIELILSSSEFKNLRGIQKLHISADNFSLTNQHVESLRGIKELSIEDVEKNGPSLLTDAAFRNLRGVQTLKLVSWEGYVNITDSAFVNLRGIRVLHLGRFPHITSAIFENLRGIQELRFRNCPKIELNAETLKNLRGIKSLISYYDGDDVASKIHLTPECLEQLVGVKKLHLENVVTVCDEAFRHLAYTTDLNVEAAHWCHHENASLSEVAFSCLKSVKRLSLGGLGLEGVESFPDLILNHMPKLEHFEVDECRVLKSAVKHPNGLRLLKLKCRPCEDNDEHVIASFDDYEFVEYDSESTTYSDSE